MQLQIQTLNNTLFKSHSIRYKIINDTLWICARDLAKPLGKDESTILRRVNEIPDNWKGLQNLQTLGGAQNLIFVTKAGAIRIILRSTAKKNSPVWEFQNWACEKLDELLSTGKTHITQMDLDYKLVSAMEIFAHGYNNSVDLLRKRQIQATMTNQANYVQAPIETDDLKPMTIQSRLIQKFEITDINKIISYSIGLGRKIAAEYRRKYDEEPNNCGQFVYGDHVQSNINHYTIEDYESWIDITIKQYLKDKLE
jgi:prophage antirepressor-like protein